MSNIYKDLSNIEASGKAAALCILIASSGSTPRKATTKMIVFADGSIKGTIGGGKMEQLVIEEAQRAIESNKAGVFDYHLTKDAGMTCGGTAQVYIEPIESERNLYIFGAGHIGSFLAKISKDLGFKVTLIDERTNIFNNLDLPDVHFINKPHLDTFADLKYNANTFICVTTHSHTYDREIIAHCAKQEFAYLGMIGSKNKIEKSKQLFREKKLLSEAQMEAIDWPMGVKINCQTPEEICISILAKLVDVKASK